MSHTPGEWRVGYCTTMHLPFHYIIEGPQCSDDEAEANSVLISAAPELLEALKVVLVALMSKSAMMSKDDWSAVNQANAAIAKAEGK